jgi:hypothetical protein
MTDQASTLLAARPDFANAETAWAPLQEFLGGNRNALIARPEELQDVWVRQLSHAARVVFVEKIKRFGAVFTDEAEARLVVATLTYLADPVTRGTAFHLLIERSNKLVSDLSC